MVLIIGGIAATAASAVALYSRVQSEAWGDPATVIRRIRQTTGVVLAVATFVRNVLDALQMLNRPVATATAGAGLRPTIGIRAGDAD